jgi:phosphomevalonate kinase
MRQMGLLSGVPIEPAEQSQILDASQKQCKGVVGGGVPGGMSMFVICLSSRALVEIRRFLLHLAGGYDAIYLIVITPSSEDTTIKPVEDLWISWKHMSVRPLSKGARVKGHTGQMGHDGSPQA